MNESTYEFSNDRGKSLIKDLLVFLDVSGCGSV